MSVADARDVTSWLEESTSEDVGNECKSEGRREAVGVMWAVGVWCKENLAAPDLVFFLAFPSAQFPS